MGAVGHGSFFNGICGKPPRNIPLSLPLRTISAYRVAGTNIAKHECSQPLLHWLVLAVIPMIKLGGPPLGIDMNSASTFPRFLTCDRVVCMTDPWPRSFEGIGE